MTVKKETENSVQVIKIEQPNPEVVYVPTYNPATVYGSWWYGYPPPYSGSRGGGASASQRGGSGFSGAGGGGGRR
jgi:uncharacterized protein DUF3300